LNHGVYMHAKTCRPGGVSAGRPKRVAHTSGDPLKSLLQHSSNSNDCTSVNWTALLMLRLFRLRDV